MRKGFKQEVRGEVPRSGEIGSQQGTQKEWLGEGLLLMSGKVKDLQRCRERPRQRELYFHRGILAAGQGQATSSQAVLCGSQECSD